jgi:hypothetical protein
LHLTPPAHYVIDRGQMQGARGGPGKRGGCGLVKNPKLSICVKEGGHGENEENFPPTGGTSVCLMAE